MQKAFRRYPIELAACPDLRDKEKERRFFDDCKLHFEHIRETVNDTFHAAGITNWIRRMLCSEPSYICEALGLQGVSRLYATDMSSFFIEMKSGKADEYAIRGKVEPKENNKVQHVALSGSPAIFYGNGPPESESLSAIPTCIRCFILPRPSWALVALVI